MQEIQVGLKKVQTESGEFATVLSTIQTVENFS